MLNMFSLLMGTILLLWKVTWIVATQRDCFLFLPLLNSLILIMSWDNCQVLLIHWYFSAMFHRLVIGSSKNFFFCSFRWSSMSLRIINCIISILLLFKTLEMLSRTFIHVLITLNVDIRIWKLIFVWISFRLSWVWWRVVLLFKLFSSHRFLLLSFRLRNALFFIFFFTMTRNFN